jgi:hypothetical protein
MYLHFVLYFVLSRQSASRAHDAKCRHPAFRTRSPIIIINININIPIRGILSKLYRQDLRWVPLSEHAFNEAPSSGQSLSLTQSESSRATSGTLGPRSGGILRSHTTTILLDLATSGRRLVQDSVCGVRGPKENEQKDYLRD